MKNILSCIIATLTLNIAVADCLGCWELKKVNIVLNSGDSIGGFVRWNELWYNILKKESDRPLIFPESLIQYYKLTPNDSELLLIKDLVNVKNDSLSGFVATKKEYLHQINPNHIKSITKINSDTSNYTGAGDILIFTQEEFEKLNTNPFAIFEIDTGVAEIHFLSYNPLITHRQLELLNEDNYADKIHELKRNGVILVILNYD